MNDHLAAALNQLQAMGSPPSKSASEYQNSVFPGFPRADIQLRNVRAYAQKSPADPQQTIAVKFCGEGLSHYANYTRWEPFVILTDMSANVRFLTTDSTAPRWAAALKSGTDPAVKQAVEQAAFVAMGYNEAIRMNCTVHSNDETDRVDYSRALSRSAR